MTCPSVVRPLSLAFVAIYLVPMAALAEQGATHALQSAAATQASARNIVRRGGPTVFSNTAPITITDCALPCPGSGQTASLYPSPITVTGETTIQRVSVRLHGLSHGYPADIDMVLQSPSGRRAVIMSDVGGTAPGIANRNVELDDHSERPLPSAVTGNTSYPFVSGTYRPANANTSDAFPFPAPSPGYGYTLSEFNGDDPNGTWNLYIVDDASFEAGSLSGGWSLVFDARPAPPAPGDVLITEFRTRGVGTSPPASDGSADEFIELYNNTDASITIMDAIPGADPFADDAGWRLSVAQGGGEIRAVAIPQILSTAGPLAIAARGTFLITTQPVAPSPAGNTYSLSSYPTGDGMTPSGNSNLTFPSAPASGALPDDVGLALYSTASASGQQRMDAVGFGAITSAAHKEGAGLAPANGIVTASNHSWTRRMASGAPQDTDDNRADFVLVDPSGDAIDGVAATLGAPGPERGHTASSFFTSSAPMHFPSGGTGSALVDPQQPADAAPNQVRDATPVANGSQGTLKFRRRFVNNSGMSLVALRFRVVSISTRTGGAVVPGQSDLRVLDSPAQTLTLSDNSTVEAIALTLQTPPEQPLGGGLNSSLSAGSVTTTLPLLNGDSRVIEFNFGVEALEQYRIVLRAEGVSGLGLAAATQLEEFVLSNTLFQDGFEE